MFQDLSFKDLSYLQLWQPFCLKEQNHFCLAKRNHLCSFSRVRYEELVKGSETVIYSCKNIYKLFACICSLFYYLWQVSHKGQTCHEFLLRLYVHFQKKSFHLLTHQESHECVYGQNLHAFVLCFIPLAWYAWWQLSEDFWPNPSGRGYMYGQYLLVCCTMLHSF